MKVSEQQHSNTKHNFTSSEWLIRIFLYSCVMITVFKLMNLFSDNHKKAYNSEAKTYIGSINRAQQAYHVEKGKFANFESFDQLGLGIHSETKNYSYRILSQMMPVQTLDESEYIANFEQGVVAIAQPKKPEFNQYIGAVFVTKIAKTQEETTMAIVCEVNAGVPFPSTLPKLIDNEIQCPKGTKPLR